MIPEQLVSLIEYERLQLAGIDVRAHKPRERGRRADEHVRRPRLELVQKLRSNFPGYTKHTHGARWVLFAADGRELLGHAGHLERELARGRDDDPAQARRRRIARV